MLGAPLVFGNLDGFDDLGLLARSVQVVGDRGEAWPEQCLVGWERRFACVRHETTVPVESDLRATSTMLRP